MGIVRPISSPSVLVIGLFILACSSPESDDTGGDDMGSDVGDVAEDAASADAFATPACSGGDSVSFAADVQPILTANCTSTQCHDAVGSAAQLDLTAGNAHAELVDVPAFQCSRSRVVAGDLDQSYLVNKLTGVDMCSGTLMPKADMRLSDSELEIIFVWICAGASAD
jgi:hypothetical protein